MTLSALVTAAVTESVAVAQTTGRSDGVPMPGDALDIATQGDAVLIVNMERILRESSAGGSIREQVDALRTSLRADLSERRDALRAEEQSLADDRGSIDRAAFAARAGEFEERVRTLRRDEQDGGARLQRAYSRATAALKQALGPILVEIMSERRAGVMLDEQQVLFNAKSLDVTNEAIKRLDDAVPRIEVKLPAPGAE